VAAASLWSTGKDADTLRLQHQTRNPPLERAGKRWPRRQWLWLLAVLSSSVVIGVEVRGEIDPPMGDPRAPITVRADGSRRWREGEYVLWLLEGNCEVRQGDIVARGGNAVLWIDPGAPLEGLPAKIIAYLEDEVSLDCARPGAPHRETGRSAQSIVGQHWLGRFHTLSTISIEAPVTGLQPKTPPELVHRSRQALEWTDDEPVRLAQFFGAAPPAAAGVVTGPTARSVSIRPRSNVRFQAKSFPSSVPNETIWTINSGVQIVVSGIENVEGIESDVISIETDRIVIWTTATAGLNLSGETVQPVDERWEFYLEGNVVFRDGDRVIYADRMYYNVNENRGTLLNAEMLTPVPDYQGLVRLKADVLEQVDKQNFIAYGGAVTSSRLGVPRYWLQSQSVTFRDQQRPVTNPFTGMITPDPLFAGEAAVEHELLATSHNNFVYFGGFPILYWPVLATDLTRPTFYIDNLRFGHDNVFGTQVKVDWDVYEVLGIRNPWPGTEWIASTDYLEQRGLGLGTNFRYDDFGLFGIPGPYRGSIDAWGIDDRGLDNLGRGRRKLIPESDLRGRVRAKHRQLLPQGFQLTSELGLVSDRNFLEQYYEREWDQSKDQTSGTELKQFLGTDTWSIRADARFNDFFTQTEWFPRFDHFLLGRSPLYERLTWYGHSSVGYGRLRVADPPSAINPREFDTWQPLDWEVPNALLPAYFADLPEVRYEGLRAATRQELDLPLTLGMVKVVPYVLGEAGYWGQDLARDDVTRLYGQAGVRASLPFWRANPLVQSRLFNLNGLAHKVVLDVDAFYADSDRALDRFPLYDPLDDDSVEDFRRRFLFSTFGGSKGDQIPLRFDERYFALRSGMQGQVTAASTEIADTLFPVKVGIRQRWQTKRGMVGQERIVDWISLDVEGTFFPEQERDNFGELFGLLDYDFRWHIGDRFTLLSDGYADFFRDGLQTFSLGGRLTRPERGQVYLGYRSVSGPFDSSLVNGSVAYRLSEKWVVSASAAVDLAKTGNIGNNVGITRIGESLLLRAGFNVDYSRDNVGVMLAIEPRFLPSSRLGRIGGVQIPPAGALGLE
jgi:hypothetical protein